MLFLAGAETTGTGHVRSSPFKEGLCAPRVEGAAVAFQDGDDPAVGTPLARQCGHTTYKNSFERVVDGGEHPWLHAGGRDVRDGVGRPANRARASKSNGFHVNTSKNARPL